MAIKTLQAKWAAKCHYCASTFPAGTTVKWDSVTKAVYHVDCAAQMGLGGGPVVSSGVPAGAVKVTGPGSLAESIAALKAKQAGAKGDGAPAPAKSYHAPKPAPVPAPVLVGGPKTQKARGIVALQSHGMLSQKFATVALNQTEAINAAESHGFPCFMRPCPITPRHGFVDSRIVKSVQDVTQVWGEAIAADPQAEAILMPYVQADYNMVWRPGLLAIGPGHDGATAGHDSISVFLQEGYSVGSGTWAKVSADAGVNLETSDPFLEAVTAGGHDTVITQVRAGVKGTVTGPDWNPAPFQIGDVITLDGASKPTPDAMLEWETTAKTLIPGYHVVHDVGGNLGDHWSVHAQLAGIAVVTTFTPKVGDLLPKMGVDLVPLDPSAIVWGFLGGALGSGASLASDVGNRRRAVCAGIMGVHHGLRMGGSAGVYLGASVAFMLRLSQATLWGEARHAEKKGISRDQIYAQVLDSWLTGRAGLGAKVSLFHTHSWGGGFGGKPWAAIGHATIDLDRAVIELLQDPTEHRAKGLVEKLNTLVNLAHNNGWFLNKFIEPAWFDLAADLDPRVALMAGPAWYQSCLTPADDRLNLLAQVETLAPIAISHSAPKGKITASKVPAKGVNMGAGSGAGGGYSSVQASKKTGGFGEIAIGGTIPGIVTLAGAQCKKTGPDSVHAQVIVSLGGQYVSGEIEGIPAGLMADIEGQDNTTSAGGSGVTYFKLQVNLETGAILCDDNVIAKVALKGAK